MALLLALPVLCAAMFFLWRTAGRAHRQSDVLSHVAHELRMPIAQILLSGETLRLGRTRSQTERDLEADTIIREAHRLRRLVENVLSFSRIAHRNAPITRRKIDLHDVIEETIESARPLADARSAIITRTIPEDVDFFADPDGLRQVLYNLLENAIKYGPPGQRISVGVVPSSTITDGLEVWVDDEGPGVPPQVERVIFEPFVRLDRDRKAGIAGSGLGLAVVRSIVQQHGGCVKIEPGLRGHGARFVVEMPSYRERQ